MTQSHPKTDMRVAETILAQLGGRRFIIMTGAKNLGGTGDSLSFKLPNRFAKDGINHIRITLDWTDTYVIEAMKIGSLPKAQVDVVNRCENVYADDLQRVFTEITGLDTHL